MHLFKWYRRHWHWLSLSKRREMFNVQFRVLQVGSCYTCTWKPSVGKIIKKSKKKNFFWKKIFEFVFKIDYFWVLDINFVNFENMFCKTNLYLSGDFCIENQCFCSNGNGATGISCQTNGDAQCDTCNSGFDLEQPCVSSPVSFTSGLGNQGGVIIITSENSTYANIIGIPMANMFLRIKSCQPWCINARFSDGQFHTKFSPSYAIDGTAVVHEY